MDLSKTNVAHDCTLCRHFVFQPTLTSASLCISNSFNCLGRELFMSKSVHWNGLSCFCFTALPWCSSAGTRLSGSPTVIGVIVPKHQIQKVSCFWKHESNYSYRIDIIIIPAQNIRCPISPKLLLRFCVSVVLFVLNRVFMSSHGRMEVTTG